MRSPFLLIALEKQEMHMYLQCILLFAKGFEKVKRVPRKKKMMMLLCVARDYLSAEGISVGSAYKIRTA